MRDTATTLRSHDPRLTHDGLKVPPDYKLAFTAFTGGWNGWNETLFSLSLYWQREGRRQRPYLVIDVGPFHFQTGWLWFNPIAR